MMNYNAKKKVLEQHRQNVKDYNKAYEEKEYEFSKMAATHEEALFTVRAIEALVQSVFNKPRGYEEQLMSIHTKAKSIYDSKYYEERYFKSGVKFGAGAAFGAAAGGVFAKNAPKAAQKILKSGNLKGPAKQVGKVIAKKAGPIGVGIAGACMLASMAVVSQEMNKTTEELKRENKKIKRACEDLRCKKEEIIRKTTSLQELHDAQKELLMRSESLKGRDYLSLDEGELSLLEVLMNNTESLAKEMNNSIR